MIFHEKNRYVCGSHFQVYFPGSHCSEQTHPMLAYEQKRGKSWLPTLFRQGCFLNPKDNCYSALISVWKHLEDKFQLPARCFKVWSLTWSTAHHKRLLILFLIGKTGWGKDERKTVFKVQWELFVLYFRKVWHYIGARYLKCTLSNTKANVIILICFQLQASQNICLCVCVCTHANTWLLCKRISKLHKALTVLGSGSKSYARLWMGCYSHASSVSTKHPDSSSL